MNKYAATPKFLSRMANVPVNPAVSMARKLKQQIQPKSYGQLIKSKKPVGAPNKPTWKTRGV